MEYTSVELSVLEREIADARTALRAGSGGESDLLRAIIDHSTAATRGYNQLAAYRSELWGLAALMGTEAF